MKKGSERYKALLDEALELHLNKNQGYSANNPDAFSNFRLAEGMGLTPVQGVLVRLGDKFARVQSLAANPENDKVGESMRDTLMDLSAYALIAVCLMEEETSPPMGVDEFISSLDHAIPPLRAHDWDTREQPDVAESPSVWGYPKPPPSCASDCSCRVDIC